MTATALLVSLLFWRIPSSAWCLIRAVPIMVAIKTPCDPIEPLQGRALFDK